jgi:type IV fimbrial biogenesis protein FimT
VKRRAATGFSILEILMVMVIAAVLAAFAIPMTINAVKSYRLTAAVSSATGAIQSTRYLAIMNGCPYQITFTPATNSYQATGWTTTSGNPATCTNAYTGAVVPISSPDADSISRVITLQFSANGTVSETTTPPAGVSPMVFKITNSIGGSNTVTVSSVGNVSVTSP